jgi:hypothetical protein
MNPLSLPERNGWDIGTYVHGGAVTHRIDHPLYVHQPTCAHQKHLLIRQCVAYQGPELGHRLTG